MSMALAAISPAEARAAVDAADAVLIDVREADEYARAHIPGSGLLPLSALAKDKLAQLTGGKKPIFLCASGARTEAAAAQLAHMAGDGAALLSGGLSNWQKTGNPVDVNKKAPLPIMRQVQIGAGSMVLGGVVLSQIAAPEWIYLSGFVGAGLLFAGVSGFCGMARLLAVMPWNKV